MLTINDMLNRPHFQEAEILTGKSGVNRKVEWVHIIEIDTFGHLLNGQEVILTTGVGWINDEQKAIHFLQQLIDHETSALCIELVKHSTSLPEKMLALAEKYDFPIIAFNQEVKFIDITKDLHEIILGYHENSWWDLDDLYKKLHQTLVSNGSIGEFLKILHQTTNKQIALVQNEEQFRFFPSPPKRKQQQWMEQIEQERMLYYSYPIYFLNEKIAELYILDRQSNISLFDELSAKRCSEFLGQYFWKHHQNKEIQQIKLNEWLLEALHGSLPKKQTTEKIYQSNSSIHLNEAIVGVIPNNDDPISREGNRNFITGTLMFLRSILENHGFYLLTTKDTFKNCYVLLLINQQENDTLYKRLNKSIQQMDTSHIDRFIYHDIQWISFGKAISNYEQLQQSYETALTTLNYQQKFGSLSEPLYKNLAVYRLINQMKDENELQEIIKGYIGPLVSYDQDNGTELLKTFQIYLKNLGSKNDTSRELYIVRQTLYHRLDRIKQLLGEDYMSPEKRLMAELSMYALEYLEKTELESIL